MNGGSYLGDKYLAVTTSYDYDAPLSEAGDPTEKYWQIQKVISKYNKIPEGPQPKPTEKLSYKRLNISTVIRFFIEPNFLHFSFFKRFCPIFSHFSFSKYNHIRKY